MLAKAQHLSKHPEIPISCSHTFIRTSLAWLRNSMHLLPSVFILGRKGGGKAQAVMITVAPLGSHGNTTSVLFPCCINEKGRILTLHSSWAVVLLRSRDTKGWYWRGLGLKKRLSSPTWGQTCALVITRSWGTASTHRQNPWDSFLLLTPLGKWFLHPCRAEVSLQKLSRAVPGHLTDCRQRKARQFGSYPPASSPKGS